MDAATITKRIRSLLGATRKELANLAGLSPSTIGRIEQGTLDPTWGTLSRILEATGYRISGDTVAPAGDPTAIAAARPLLESLLASAPARPDQAIQESTDPIISQWLARWTRAGWLSEQPDTGNLVSVAISAGNAGKIARRNVARRSVRIEGGWRDLARRLGEADIAYAVTGLISARQDRTTAASINPIIYVDDPTQAVATLDLEETTPGQGVLLIAPRDSLIFALVGVGVSCGGLGPGRRRRVPRMPSCYSVFLSGFGARRLVSGMAPPRSIRS